MSQQRPHLNYPYDPSYLVPAVNRGTYHNGLAKPDPVPLQHHAGSSSSSVSSGYHSTSASTANTSGQSVPSVPPGSYNGAAALLHQHQANQNAFRSNPAPHFVYQGQAGPSSEHRPHFDGASRESSASSSTRESEGSAVKQESDPYDPFRIKHRRRTSPSQLKILEHHFDSNPKPDVTIRKALSEQLDMTPREVQVWFQNRRAKVKKLKERANRDTATSSREGDSPPDAQFDEHSRHSLAPMGDLPIPPSGFPPPTFPSRTIYGQDVISQRRTSPPAPILSPMICPPQGQAGLTVFPSQPHLGLPPPGAYQSTIYTTTVASSTYATNEYHPPHPPAFLPDDANVGRRYSLPTHTRSHDHGAWSSLTATDPSAISNGFALYQPPSIPAPPSSAPSSCTDPASTGFAQLSSYPSFPPSTFTPTNLNIPAAHDRGASYDSGSIAYNSSGALVPSPADYDLVDPSSSIAPRTSAPSDPFSGFVPLAPVPHFAGPTISPAPYLDDPSIMSSPLKTESRLRERRASMAHPHRQSMRLKPYDQNERTSPARSHSPQSQ